MSQTVVTRFAPSPTGHLHIGGARTALFCWALAAHERAQGRGGRFLLRIEDTDRARSSADAAAGILEDLAWLGIGWDDGPAFETDGRSLGGDDRAVGPFHQSERLEIYNAHLEKLIAAGLAYPAFETPDELGQMRKKAEAEKRSFIYRRREDYDHSAALERARTEDHVLRFRMPAEPVTVVDRVLGEVSFPYEELDDLVIRKKDGFPTYHFAVVCDDALMGVTHVLRGQEHLNNAPKHVALFRALGFEVPVFAHMPLIFNSDGSKMSKRDKDKIAKKAWKEQAQGQDGTEARGEIEAQLGEEKLKKWAKDKQAQLGRDELVRLAGAMDLTLPEIDVEDFRAAGYLPEVVVNFIALLGWNPGVRDDEGKEVERFDAAFLAEHFDVVRIGKSNARFDREKLAAFNAATIQHGMTDGRFAELWLAWAERFDSDLAGWAKDDPGRWAIAARAARPRCKTLRDGRGVVAFAMLADDAVAYDAKAVKKGLLKGDPSGLGVLRDVAEDIGAIGDWSSDGLEAGIGKIAESRGVGLGKIAGPLRVAITGTNVSPPLGETLALVGREGVGVRIERCLDTEHG